MSRRRIAGISLGWAARVTIAAVIGILLLKWISAKIPVPGLQSAIHAV